MRFIFPFYWSFLAFMALFHAHADSNQRNTFFPVELTFSINIKDKLLSVNVLNRSNEEVVIDLIAVKAVQLVYWFTVGEKLISSGYEAFPRQDVFESDFDKVIASKTDRFIKVPPGKGVEHTIFLDDLLKIIRPLAARIADDDFVGIQLFGTGLSIARARDGRIVFDERLYRTVSSGKPLAIDKQQIEQMLK